MLFSVKKRVLSGFLGLFILVVGGYLAGCRSSSDQGSSTRVESAQTSPSATNQSIRPGKAPVSATQRGVPGKVHEVLAYIKKYDRAPEGYVGGRKFGNYEKHLPQSAATGKRIQYREWDVNPRKEGKNRGAERLVTGSDGRAWYTRDHYNTFAEVLPGRGF